MADVDVIQLERFVLKRVLGIGANYEVHAAVDSQTGAEVVLKRPWPQSISRDLHQQVDKLSARLIDVHRALGDSFPYISHLLGYTEYTRHDQYYGDALPQKYHVLVEERARGVPLVGGIRDKFLGVPIGLSQNLFTIYPLVSQPGGHSWVILEQLLDVEEALNDAGYLVLDLRPQNIFFDPRDARITVIDIGTVLERDTAEGQMQRMGLHDFFMELCKFYLSPHNPPADVRGYREPFGMGPPLGFERELARMLQNFQALTTGLLQESAIAILHNVQARTYGTVSAFRGELQRYLARVDERNGTLSDLPRLVDVWREGMEMLRDKYWQQFLFDPHADLIHYR